MDEYRKLIDSHKNIKKRCSNADELCSFVYKEISAPTFELYQPASKMVKSQTLGVSSGETSQTTDGRLTPDISTSRLLELQSRSLTSANTGHILSDEQRKSFKGLVLVAKDLIQNEKLNKGNLASHLAKIKNLPLEVLWWYHCSDIVHITIYIALNLESSDELERIGSGLNELMQAPSGEGLEAAVATDFLAALTSMVHGPDPPSSLQDTRKACCIILQSIIRRQLAAIKAETGAVWWLQRLLGVKSTLSAPVMQSFASELLHTQLTEPPYISVHQTLARQSEWSYNLSHEILTTFFSQVLQALSPTPKALDILMSVLQGGDEVNWRAVLLCVSTFLNCLPDAAAHMNGLISDFISRALASDSRDLLVLSFLLARQCAVESFIAGCLPYPAWFKRTFGTRSSSLASAQSHSRFLLEFLTQLVPHEPVACLKAHIDQAPWVPAASRPQLQDYLALASTRLRDLGRGATDVISGLFQHEPACNVTSVEEQVKFDIIKALAHFEKSGKIHLAIFEGSIFKKKYFESNFLPELLKPRVLPATNDTQMLLVDKMLKAGKITPQQYNKYHSQCLAAAASGNI